MAIDAKFIEELKNKNDIVDIVSGYCALTERGGNLWANCPLPGHSERTPSFSVNRYGQFFKCFGCGRGGDVITFVQEMESFNYIEAVRFLAEKANMAMPDSFVDEKKTDEAYKKKATLLSILKDSALFYVHNLRSGNAAAHTAYLEKRGITREIATAFGLGASLDYNGLPEYLRARGYSYEDMKAAGVVSETERKNAYYLQRQGQKVSPYGDFEAHRLIFPIINTMGEVVAFGGRVLEKTEYQGKYKNTRETSVFVKNKMLYNINRIKKLKSVGPIPEIIMVEGYMDTISLVSAGFENVVASMGTSLTKEQARLLKRYTEKVLICYDGDSAGKAANIRGMEILKNEGLEVRIVSLPEGMDPDDVIRKLGADAYRQCLADALPLIDFKISVAAGKYNDGTEAGKRRFVSEAVNIIRASETVAEKEDLGRKLAKETGITYQSIMRDVEKDPAPAKKPPRETKADGGKESNVVKAERYILARAITAGKRKIPFDFNVSAVHFTDDTRQEIAAYIADFNVSGLEVRPTALYDYMGEEGREETEAVLSHLGDKLLEEDDGDKFLKDCLAVTEKNFLEGKLEALKKEAEGETDSAKRKEIARSIMEIAIRIKNL